jgi:uncharacterized membrane protein YhaH (DUF805 family)
MADMTANAPQPALAGRLPLGQPDYGISPLDAIGRFYRKYGTFAGRASRGEFWWAVLFYWTVVMALCIPLAAYVRSAAVAYWEFILDSVRSGGVAKESWDNLVSQLDVTDLPTAQLACLIAISIWVLANAVPASAVFCRRLHDGGHSGLWWFTLGIPLVNLFPLALLCMPPSDRGYLFDKRPSSRTRLPSDAQTWEVPGFSADADPAPWGYPPN